MASPEGITLSLVQRKTGLPVLCFCDAPAMVAVAEVFLALGGAATALGWAILLAQKERSILYSKT